jgi:hypothetical protein
MMKEKALVVCTFHDVVYKEQLPLEKATVGDVRSFVSVGCKQGHLDPSQYGVFCCGERVADSELLSDIGLYEFAIKPLLTRSPAALRPSHDEMDSIGMKRTRGGEPITPQGKTLADVKDEKEKKLTVSPASLSVVGTAPSSAGGGEQQDSIGFRFVIGSVATLTDEKEESKGEENIHRWTAYVRGERNQDISTVVESVTFILHETFKNRVREIKTPPYEVHERGWGQFWYTLKIKFHHLPAQVLLFQPLLAFGHPLKTPHTIPPNPPPADIAPPYLFPPISRTKKPVVHEVHEEAVFFNAPEALKSAIRLTSGVKTAHPTKGTSQWKDIVEYGSPDTSAEQLDEINKLKQIRNELRETNAKLKRVLDHYATTQPAFSLLASGA